MRRAMCFTRLATDARTPLVILRNPLLNQPKNPVFSKWCPAFTCFRYCAQRAGVSVRATMTDKTIADTIVTEN